MDTAVYVPPAPVPADRPMPQDFAVEQNRGQRLVPSPADVPNVPLPIKQDIYSFIRRCGNKMQLKRSTFTAGASVITLATANDTRISLWIATAGSNVSVDIINPPVSGQGVIIVPSVVGLQMTWDDWGPLVQQAWYAPSGGLNTFTVYEILLLP